MDATLRLHSLPFSSVRTYLTAALFVIGNIALPQLLHLVPQGGVTWLPIYFFTLVGAYKYGWRGGLLTALAAPGVHSLLFGTPPGGALSGLRPQTGLPAPPAGGTASRFNKATMLMLVAVVLGYQVLGTLGEWVMKADIYAACQDFRIGIPGMLFQIIGGWIMINLVIRRH